MSNAQTLLARCQELGATLTPSPEGKLKIKAPAPLSRELREELREHKAEVLALLKAPAPTSSFLSRPLGQENNPGPWNAWGPFFDWLREYHPDHFFAVCGAEEAIEALERAGITTGPEYERACTELLHRFEEARRLKLSAEVKVWIQ